jgi:transcriptional regulator with XRE-family HTH domain
MIQKEGQHMSKSYDNLREDFIINKDEKEYRHAYGEESTDISVGTQIKVLREQREWRQEDLAHEAGIQQPMVSRYESVNYSNWTITTLKKLARAYDVWLDIRFRSFGDLVNETNRFSRESLQVPAFADDPFFKVRRKVSRPKIRAVAQVTAQVVPFDPRYPTTLRSMERPPTGATQMHLQWDWGASSGLGPKLVTSSPQPQGSSVMDHIMKAAAGAGESYARR